MKYVATFKICIFGDPGVGKTSIIHRFVTNQFKHNMRLTLGADIIVKAIEINNYKVKLQIWDFGGPERFKIFFPAYTLGASGGIFMYDISRKSSLNSIEDYVKIFQKNLREKRSNIPILVVGGKNDLDHYREVTIKNAEFLTKTHNIYDIVECSAKTGDNAKKIFKSLTYKMLEIINLI